MAHILWQRTAVRDGWHNAFTDLCFWRDSYWLTFRRGSSHVSPDGTIVVLRSVDLKRWHEATRLKTSGDDRDPKLCPTEGRLYVFFGTWLPRPRGWPDEQFGPMVSHTSSTTDGTSWSEPSPAYKQNAWLWRIRRHKREFYCPAYGWDDPRDKTRSFLDLLRSKDGLAWDRVGRIAGEEDRPDEADLHFTPDGQIVCVSRSSRKPDHSLLYSSSPPYESWERADLGTTIHCPILCETAGELYVAGRRRTDAPWIAQATPAGNTGIFRVKGRKVEPLLALPSDGDAAYPGLISMEPSKFLISYYSQHAYLGGVIGHNNDASDIYLAGIATA
jgi:hypothetical protein